MFINCLEKIGGVIAPSKTNNIYYGIYGCNPLRVLEKYKVIYTR